MKSYTLILSTLLIFTGCSLKDDVRRRPSVVKKAPQKTAIPIVPKQMKKIVPEIQKSQKPTLPQIQAIPTNQTRETIQLNPRGDEIVQTTNSIEIVEHPNMSNDVIIIEDDRVHEFIGEPINDAGVPITTGAATTITPKKTIKNRLNKSNSKSFVVTFKTKKFSFSDTGFLRNNGGKTLLQVFAVGRPLLDLKILRSDDICVGSICNTKHGFNQSYLVGEYPDELINNVLNSRPIFRGKNMKKTSNGFMQKITTKDYAIKYKIAPNNIYFKDTKNNILMKLRRL